VGIEAMRSRVAEAMEHLERLRAGYTELHHGLQAVSATATSDDGLVTVTVGPQGRVVRLELDPRIYRRPDSRRLAETITATIKHAADEAELKVRRLCRPFMADEEITAHLTGDVDALVRRLEDELVRDDGPVR
jgi:DNA-binding protein YbaB